MDLGPNAVFVWSAYGVFAAVIAAVLLWLIAEGARLQRKLDRLDAEGVRRRSARPAAGAPKGPD